MVTLINCHEILMCLNYLSLSEIVEVGGRDNFYIKALDKCVWQSKPNQCCARVSPGAREPDPWAKIFQNRAQNRQNI